MIRADITAEITPIIGTEKQCEELVQYMLRNLKTTRKKFGFEIFASRYMIWFGRYPEQIHRAEMPDKLQETLKRLSMRVQAAICIII